MLLAPLVGQVLALEDISSHSWRIQPCSAVTGANLLTGLDWVVENVSNRIYHFGTIGVGHSLATAGGKEGAVKADETSAVESV